MTKYGNKIPDLTPERVREQLADVGDPKANKRLTAAREYLAGLSPTQIEDKYGWHRQTIYNWLNRFEDALYDDDRPGRPPELSEEQFQHFAEALHQPPEGTGYDEPAWTSSLAQQHLVTEFEVAYSRRHVQRLMKKAEVSWNKPRPEPSSATEEELEVYDEDIEKSRQTRRRCSSRNNRSFRKTVGADLTYAWFPIHERPTVDVSSSHEGLNLLGALTEHGETLFLEFSGSFTKEVTVQFLQVLQAKFGEKLVVVLDKGSYFTAKKVKQFVQETEIELM